MQRLLLSESTLRMLQASKVCRSTYFLYCDHIVGIPHIQEFSIEMWRKEGSISRKGECTTLHWVEGVVGMGSITSSFLTLICSSYLMERPLSQSKPNLIRWITKRLGKTLMHVRFTVVLLKRQKSITSIYITQASSNIFL